MSPDSIYVGQWVLETYGPRHPVTAIFMDHAVANSNYKVLELYLAQDSARNRHVPVTLKHFQILAKLGADPVRLLHWRCLYTLNVSYLVLANVAGD